MEEPKSNFLNSLGNPITGLFLHEYRKPGFLQFIGFYLILTILKGGD